MTRLLRRLAPLALVVLAAIHTTGCASSTDGAADVDVGAARTVQLRSLSATELAQESARLEASRAELASLFGQVHSTGWDLAAGCSGPQGDAFQQAMVRFDDAAAHQLQELDRVLDAVRAAHGAYDPQPTSGLGFTNLKYNFGGIEGATSALVAFVSQTTALLDLARSSIARLDMDPSALTSWDATSSELAAALRDLAQRAEAAGSAMQDTEKGVAGMFQ